MILKFVSWVVLILCKQMINLPHKRPEPLHLAGKYSREVRKELTGTPTSEQI